MKIYCEIPDHIGRIFKEFLQISEEDDRSVGHYMALYVARKAQDVLYDQWHKLDWQLRVSWGGDEKITQEEIGNKIDILEIFCREMEGQGWRNYEI
ncbi:hypothetical protein [Mageeibacillus indolicus]|uniref:hypothetical protein n=1 Tax=Mageeibacillus indolicus TaxID=884684 RepID=UPI0004DD83CF|nr:hypothetical protein [Mageeibacillus indolicus]KFA57785.1 hypothetical protein HMPREF1632_00450 [Mageeibacillus indolicus 0009-5]